MYVGLPTDPRFEPSSGSLILVAGLSIRGGRHCVVAVGGWPLRQFSELWTSKNMVILPDALFFYSPIYIVNQYWGWTLLPHPLSQKKLIENEVQHTALIDMKNNYVGSLPEWGDDAVVLYVCTPFFFKTVFISGKLTHIALGWSTWKRGVGPLPEWGDAVELSMYPFFSKLCSYYYQP